MDPNHSTRSSIEAPRPGHRQASQIVARMSNALIRATLARLLSTGESVLDIIQIDGRDILPDAREETSMANLALRPITHVPAPTIPSSLASNREAEKMAKKMAMSEMHTVKSKSDPKDDGPVIDTGDIHHMKSPSHPDDATSPPGQKAPNPHSKSHINNSGGGIINIYNNYYQCHSSQHAKQNPPVEHQEQEPTENDQAFLDTLPGASHAARHPDVSAQADTNARPVPDTAMSREEKDRILDSVSFILSQDRRDRAAIFKNLLTLAFKTGVEKWDATAGKRGGYVPLAPAAVLEIRARLEEQAEVSIITEGLVSPHRDNKWEVKSPEQLTEHASRRESSGHHSDTKVTFICNSSDWLEELVDCGTPPRRLPVPTSAHDTPKPKVVPWTKSNDKEARGDLTPRASTMQPSAELQQELESMLYDATPSPSEASALAPTPLKNLDILTKVARNDKTRVDTDWNDPEPKTKRKSVTFEQAHQPAANASSSSTAATTQGSSVQRNNGGAYPSRPRVTRSMMDRNNNQDPPAPPKSDAVGKKVRRQNKKSASMAGEKPCVKEEDADVGTGCSKPENDRLAARTADLDTVVKMASEAAATASQPANGSNLTLLLGEVPGERIGEVPKERKCRLCRAMFTDRTNVRREDGSAPCSYHPGPLEMKDSIAKLHVFKCCGGPPIMVGPGIAAMNVVSPGCVKCYHQEKASAWDLNTLRMKPPKHFEG